MTSPGRFDIALGGRGFLVDWDSNQFRGPASVPLLRNQADTSGRPGESALNPEDFWRRFISSWHHGAGQSVYDADDSDVFRFHESSGVDPWTKNELTLLPSVVEVWDERHPYRLVSVTDTDVDYLFLINGSSTLYIYAHVKSSAPSYPDAISDFDATFTTGGVNIADIATDGTNIYTTSGSDIYMFTADATTIGSAYNTLDADRLWYARGRLMAAKGPSLYNVTSGTPPSALLTHGNAGWEWNSVTEAGAYIYASGAAGDRSMIYKIGITADGTSLDAPVSAVQMPDGEIITSVLGYAGVVLVGTNKGCHLASPDAEGFLTLGKLLPIGPVSAFEGQGNFVWAGTSVPYADTSGTCKLWRLDLTEFTAPLTPAYAEDMIGDATPISKLAGVNVWTASIVTFIDRRFWVINSDASDGIGDPSYGHVYAESDVPLSTGWVTSGKIRYGILDSKVASYLDATMLEPEGDEVVTFTLSLDGATPASVGGLGDETSTSLAITSGANTTAEITATLATDIADNAPFLTGIALRSFPAPARIQVWQIPLIIAERTDWGGATVGRNAEGDLDYIIALAAAPDPSTTMSFGTKTYNAFVEDYAFAPSGQRRLTGMWSGTCLVKIKTHSEVVEE